LHLAILHSHPYHFSSRHQQPSSPPRSPSSSCRAAPRYSFHGAQLAELLLWRPPFLPQRCPCFTRLPLLAPERAGQTKSPWIHGAGEARAAKLPAMAPSSLVSLRSASPTRCPCSMASSSSLPWHDAAAPFVSPLALLTRPPAAMADLHSLGAGAPNSHGTLPCSPAPSLPSSLPWARAPPPAMDAAQDPPGAPVFPSRAAPYSTSMAAQLPWTPRNSSSEPPSSLFVVVPAGCSTKCAASRALQQPSRSISTPLVACRRSRARYAAPSATP
jgi:hypothetical protein